MRTTIIHCDICNREIVQNGSWENEPCTVQILFGPPKQKYESKVFNETCTECVDSLINAINTVTAIIKKRYGQPE